MKNSLIWQYNGIGLRENGLREGWSLLKKHRSVGEAGIAQ